MAANSNECPFTYEPLQNDGESCPIRLCRLLPAPSLDEQIKCELFEAKLGESESFEALSYTWGDLDDPVHIVVNGMQSFVTQNLALALQHLRRKDQPRLLWIDALSINQSDLVEKSQQVSFMQGIFRPGGASQVVVWLGMVPSTRLAIEFCKRIQDCVDKESQWNTKCQKNRNARVPYLGKPIGELPYNEKAAQHAARQLWEYLRINRQTTDMLAFFKEQQKMREVKVASDESLLSRIRMQPSSQFSRSYLLDQAHIHSVSCAAAEILASHIEQTTETYELELKSQRTSAAKSTTVTYIDGECSRLDQDIQSLPLPLRDLQLSRLNETSKPSDMEELKVFHDLHNIKTQEAIWSKLQGIRECQQAIRYLWGAMEDEMERTVAGHRINEMRQEYKDENQACQGLFEDAAWWKRIWILQEVIHRGEVEVLLSRGDLVPLEALLDAYNAWNKWQMLYRDKPQFTTEYVAANWQRSLTSMEPDQFYNYYDSIFSSSLHHLSSKSHIVDSRAAAKRNEAAPNLAELIMNFREHSSTDPRDMIYALLGMANPDSSGADLVIDYHASVRKVYTQIARKLTRRVLLILLLVESPDRHISLRGELPSWVPDYRTEQVAFPRTQVFLYVRFSADEGFPPPSDIEPRFHQDLDQEHLMIRGLYVGIITHTRDARLPIEDKVTPQGAIRIFAYDRCSESREKDATTFSHSDTPNWDDNEAVTRSSWGPIHAEPGDWIVVAAQLQLPILIRPIKILPHLDGDQPTRCLFVGGCWLIDSELQDGIFHQTHWTPSAGFSPIMFGSAVREQPSDWQPELFMLV